MKVVTINYDVSQDKTKLNWNMDFFDIDTLAQLDALKDAIKELEAVYETISEDFEEEFQSKSACKVAKSILGI